MLLTFDPGKDKEDVRKHGISLARSPEFDRASARYFIDDSQNDGEERIIAIGFLDARLHIMVFTELTQKYWRIISLRKADPQERKDYAEEF